MEDDSKLSYFFLGLGLGVAVGVLFAPKSGQETRELLKSKAGEGADYVKRASVDLREQAEDVLDRESRPCRSTRTTWLPPSMRANRRIGRL